MFIALANISALHIILNILLHANPMEAGSNSFCKVEFIQSCVGFIMCQICLYFSN